MPGGRPTKRTPEVVAKLKALIGLGLTRERAAIGAGISPRTFQEWLTDPEFSQELKAAEIAGETECLLRVRKGALGWQGAAWILERRHHRRWKRRTEQTVKKDPIDAMSADELKEWLAKVAREEGIS